MSRGFKGPREINTVLYDPAVVSPAEMVDALVAAGIYIGRAEGEPGN